MKVLAAKANNLSSIPRTNMVKEKNQLLCAVLTSACVLSLTFVCVCVSADTHKTYIKKAIYAILLLISYPKSMYSLA